MHVSHFYFLFSQIFCKVFGHSLCKGSDKSPLFFMNLRLYLIYQVINLIVCWSDLYFWINKSGGSYKLFYNSRTIFLFVIRRCCGYKQGGLYIFLKFKKFERTIIKCTRQSE